MRLHVVASSNILSLPLRFSLDIVVESASGGVSGVAPLWHPVVRYEMAAVWKQILKHLSVVIGLLSVGNNATELGASLSKRVLVNLHVDKVGESNEVCEIMLPQM